MRDRREREEAWGELPKGKSKSSLNDDDDNDAASSSVVGRRSMLLFSKRPQQLLIRTLVRSLPPTQR